jgi:hypothetical protein
MGEVALRGIIGAGLWDIHAYGGDQWERKAYCDYFEKLKEANRTTSREKAGLGILLC